MIHAQVHEGVDFSPKPTLIATQSPTMSQQQHPMLLLQVQCFDSSGTRLEFQALETFGFLPVPEILMEEAMHGVEVRKVKILTARKGYQKAHEQENENTWKNTILAHCFLKASPPLLDHSHPCLWSLYLPSKS